MSISFNLYIYAVWQVHFFMILNPKLILLYIFSKLLNEISVILSILQHNNSTDDNWQWTMDNSNKTYQQHTCVQYSPLFFYLKLLILLCFQYYRVVLVAVVIDMKQFYMVQYIDNLPHDHENLQQLPWNSIQINQKKNIHTHNCPTTNNNNRQNAIYVINS